MIKANQSIKGTIMLRMVLVFLYLMSLSLPVLAEGEIAAKIAGNPIKLSQLEPTEAVLDMQRKKMDAKALAEWKREYQFQSFKCFYGHSYWTIF